MDIGIIIKYVVEVVVHKMQYNDSLTVTKQTGWIHVKTQVRWRRQKTAIDSQ